MISIFRTSTATIARGRFRGALALGAVIFASLLPAQINAGTIPFTHSNVPLGISLAQFKQQYPECGAEKAPKPATLLASLAGWNFRPLTGYDPPSPDLLPTYHGSYLMTHSWAAQVASLGDEYFNFYFIACRGGNNQSQIYTALIYQGKIAVVEKNAVGQGPADHLMSRLQPHLSGRQGPLHKARQAGPLPVQAADVVVAYADEGNIRTVVETRPAVGGYYDEAVAEVAYVDLILWRNYSSRIEAKLKSTSEKEEREARTLTQSNLPLGISIAQFQQQYPQCRADKERNPPGAFPLLSGYAPPFLLPNFPISVFWRSGEPMPTLKDAYLTLSSIDCAAGTNRSQYTALVYQGTIAAVYTAAKKAKEPLDRIIARLQQHLSGRQGPLQKARTMFSGGSPADVLVTYADEGNTRTVVAAQAEPGLDEVIVYVAHVDLSLWREYSSRVEGKLKAMSEAGDREVQTLTRSNLPLGISLAQFQQQYPQCRATKDLYAGYTTSTTIFEPLVGYYPPFPDLLPNYHGSYFMVSVPWASGSVPTLGEGYFTLRAIYCGEGTDQSRYTALIYRDKIAVISEGATEAGQPADRVMPQFQRHLSGRQGPLHNATNMRSQEFGSQVLDALVTYADEDNIRTVVETDNTSVATGVNEPVQRVQVQVAHVDLSLWRDYSRKVEAKLKAVSEREEWEAKTLTHPDLPLGITLAQLKQQYPQCHTSEGFLGKSDFGPLVGYNPPFLELLPIYQGRYPSYRASGGERIAILEFEGFPRIDCGSGANQSQYTAIIYQGKIAVVGKSMKEAGQGPADRIIARIQQRLPRRQPPLHKAVTWQGPFHHDVLVTYADEGNIRTVVEAEAVPGVDEVIVRVAHIDLSLWRDYSSRVEAEAKATSEREEQKTRKIEQEL